MSCWSIQSPLLHKSDAVFFSLRHVIVSKLPGCIVFSLSGLLERIHDKQYLLDKKKTVAPARFLDSLLFRCHSIFNEMIGLCLWIIIIDTRFIAGNYLFKYLWDITHEFQVVLSDLNQTVILIFHQQPLKIFAGTTLIKF